MHYIYALFVTAMKHMYLLLLSTFLVTAAFSQESVQFNLRDFDKIEISSAFIAEISQGATYRIEVSIPEGTKDKLKVEKEGNELDVSFKGSKGSSGQHKIKIQLPELKSLEVSGASSVTLSEFQGQRLDAEVSGASTLQGKLSYNNMEMEVSGASSIKLEGTVNSAKLYLSGASNLGSATFSVKGDLVLDLSGASNATLTADGDMYLQLSGASTFSYSGVGNVLKQEVTGASHVEKLGGE